MRNTIYNHSLKPVRFLTTLFLTVPVAVVLTGCDVDKTAEGEMPDVDIDADAGELPEYEVVKTEEGRAPDVDVDVEGGKLPEYDVDVPDVNVETKKVTVTVPTIDIEADQEDEWETEKDRVLITTARTTLQQKKITTADVLKEVQFTANNGVIVIEGEVPNEQVKNQIATQVAALPGVTRVNNQLEVQ